MTSLTEHVGFRIKGLRKQAGYTLDELGSKLEMKGHSVWRLETGRRAPSLEILEQLAQIFSVPPAYFLSDDSLRTQGIDVMELDPVLRDLWEELHQRFQHEHPITREQATAILQAILNALRAFDSREPARKEIGAK